MTKEERNEITGNIALLLVALFISWFVVCVFSSCGVSHDTQAQGRTVIITSDTTVINHGGYIKYHK